MAKGFNLRAWLGLDTKDFNKGLKKADKEVKALGSQFKKIGSIIAAAFAIDKLIDFTKSVIEIGLATEGVERAFNQFANAGYLEKLQKETDGTISKLNLMTAAVKFNNFALPLQQLGGLLQFVRLRAQQTGDSFEYLFDSMVEGLSKTSTQKIDNLGISLNRLNAELAKGLSFTEAVAKIANEELKKAGGVADTTATKVAKLKTRWDDFKSSLFTKASEAGVFTDISTALDDIDKSVSKESISKGIRTLISLTKALIKNIKLIGGLISATLISGAVIKGIKLLATAWSGVAASIGMVVKTATAYKKAKIAVALAAEAKQASLFTAAQQAGNVALIKRISLISTLSLALVGATGVVAAFFAAWGEMSDDDRAEKAKQNLISYRRELDKLSGTKLDKSGANRVAVILAEISKEKKILEEYQTRHRNKPTYTSTGQLTASKPFNVSEISEYTKLQEKSIHLLKSYNITAKESPDSPIAGDKDVITGNYELQKALLEHLIKIEEGGAQGVYDNKIKLLNLVYDHDKNLAYGNTLELNKAYYAYIEGKKSADTAYNEWYKTQIKARNGEAPNKVKGLGIESILNENPDKYAGWIEKAIPPTIAVKDATDDYTESLRLLADVTALVGEASKQTMEDSLIGWVNYVSTTISAVNALITSYKELAKAKGLAILGPIGAGLGALSMIISPLLNNKTKKYATGGIVGGTSFSGDNIVAGLNSGEMVLNKGQQAELFYMANGNNGANGGQVEFEIRGDRLVGVLNKYNRKINKIR